MFLFSSVCVLLEAKANQKDAKSNVHLSVTTDRRQTRSHQLGKLSDCKYQKVESLENSQSLDAQSYKGVNLILKELCGIAHG